MTYRSWHRSLAPFAAIPLMLTAVTGLAYKWSVDLLGMDHDSAKWWLKIHQGSYFKNSAVLYTGMVASLLLYMILTGYTMMRGFWRRGFNWSVPNSSRRLHQFAGPFIFVPLALTAITGVSYRWGRKVFMMDSEQIGWLMDIHQGNFFFGYSLLYVTFVGTSLLTMAGSGLCMVSFVRNWLFRNSIPQNIDEDWVRMDIDKS